MGGVILRGFAGNVGIKFEASDNVGNAGTSVYYSLWIDGTAPAFSSFAPTVWVKSGTVATVTITARRHIDHEVWGWADS